MGLSNDTLMHIIIRIARFILVLVAGIVIAILRVNQATEDADGNLSNVVSNKATLTLVDNCPKKYGYTSIGPEHLGRSG